MRSRISGGRRDGIVVYEITFVSAAVSDPENEKSHSRSVKNRIVREVSNRENWHRLEAASWETPATKNPPIAIRLPSNRVRSSGFCKLKFCQTIHCGQSFDGQSVDVKMQSRCRADFVCKT